MTYIANKLLEAGMQSEQMRRYLDAHTPWQVLHCGFSVRVRQVEGAGLYCQHRVNRRDP